MAEFYDELVKVELCFKFDEKTANGHIYSRDTFTKAFEAAKEKRGNVLIIQSMPNFSQEWPVDQRDAIAFATELNEDDTISVKTRPRSHDYDFINSKIAPRGTGMIDDDGNIYDYILDSFNFVNENNRGQFVQSILDNQGDLDG